MHRRGLVVGLLALAGACSDSTSPHKELLIKPGDVVDGTVSGGSPAVYRLGVAANHQLVVYVHVPGPVLAVTLLDANNSAIGIRSAGNDAPTDTLSRWVATPLLTSDAVYTLEVATYGTTQQGSFRLRVAEVDRRPEHTSDTLALGQIVQDAIDQPMDVDEYAFHATAGQMLEVYIQRLATTGSNMYALITDAGGSPIGFPGGTAAGPDADLEQSASGIITIPATGTYHLTINGNPTFPAQTGPPYRLQVLPIDPAPEHAAATLVVGDTVANESIDHVGDIDEFTLTGAPGAAFNLFVEATGNPPHAVTAEWVNHFDVTTTASAAAGLPLLENATGRFTMPAAGTLPIRVHDQSASGGLFRGPYRLFVARIDSSPEGVAPVTAAGAPPIVSAIEIPGDVDDYSFAVTSTTTVNLLLTRGANATGSGLRAQLFNLGSGGVVWSYPPSITAYAAAPVVSTGHIALEPGNYRLGIDGESSRGDGYRGAYQVELRITNPSPETVSSRVAIGDTVRGESLEYAGDVDTYTLSVGVADTFNITLRTPTTANPGIYFYVADAVTGARVGSAQFDQEHYPAPLQSGRLVLDPGDYRIVVEAANGGSLPTEAGPYELAIAHVSAGPEHRASALAFGDTVQDEPIDYIGDYDDFYLHGQPGQEMAARFLWIGPGGAGSLAIVDSATGAALTGTPSYCCEQDTRRATFPASGVLKVRVQSLGAYTGAYRFVAYLIDRAPETRAATFALGDTVADAIDPSPDVDEYIFQGAAGQSVDVFFQLPNGLMSYGPLQLDVIDLSTGTVLTTIQQSDYTPNLEDVSRRGIILPTSGAYRVRVQGVLGEWWPDGNYRFRIAPSP